MSDKIYIKRSVKEKLPHIREDYNFFTNSGYQVRLGFNPKDIHDVNFFKEAYTHWLEEVPLEEYLKEIGLTVINK